MLAQLRPHLRVRCSLWYLSCSSSFTENMDEPSMYICHSMQDLKVLCQILMERWNKLEDSKGEKHFLDCVYRPLCAVLHIIDRQLDLSLLSDHGVLKERHAAQIDRVTGALRTDAQQGRDQSRSVLPDERRQSDAIPR